MPPESHPNYTIASLIWILFGLWCFSLVILSMAVFDMDIAEYNATCYLVNFYNFFLRNWVDKFSGNSEFQSFCAFYVLNAWIWLIYYLHVEKSLKMTFQYVHILGIRFQVLVSICKADVQPFFFLNKIFLILDCWKL